MNLTKNKRAFAFFWIIFAVAAGWRRALALRLGE